MLYSNSSDSISSNSIYSNATQATANDIYNNTIVSTAKHAIDNYCMTISTSDYATYDLNQIVKDVEQLKNTVYNKKEESKNMFNFDFGPVNTNSVHMSPYGLAIKNKTGAWVSYDTSSKSIMDVEVFNFAADKFLYKMPVALESIQSGDVLIHQGYPMFVENVYENCRISVVDIATGENKIIMPTKSPFGFNFYTKVVNVMDMCGGMQASEDNPFGNMWMFALMSDGKCDDNMLPLMMMANGNFGNGAMNPMMMYMLARNGSNDNLLPLMFMMQGGFPVAQPATK